MSTRDKKKKKSTPPENAEEQVKVQPADKLPEAQPVAEETAADAVAEEVKAEASEAQENSAPVTVEPVTVEAKPRGDKVLTKKQKRIRTVLRWVLLIAGIIMMSCSVYFFQTPNKFTLGGVAGIAILIANYVPLSQGVIMAIINVFLLILGLIILGKQCTIRTIFCSLMYTGIIWLFEYVDVLGHITGTPTPSGGIAAPMTTQPFLELVYAILLFGVGGALIFNCGASSGGTDIIALILKKYTKLNVGFALMLIDFLVVCISFYTFDSVEAGLFSLMGLFTKSFLLDGVIESLGKTKYITIITTHPEAISEYILNVIQHGFTMYDAQGGYTGEPKKVLITVCKRGEALKLKAKVKQIDTEAFVIITDANEILGKGFGGTI